MPTAAISERTSKGLNGARTAAGLRHRLRNATADAHERLDARFGGLDLQNLADYRQFLEASAAALLPLETALIEAGVGRIFPDWKARSRRRAILNDLGVTGGDYYPLPVPRPLDFGGVLGVMYVLEGSRLGAKVLLNKIVRSANPRVAAATAYLRHGAGQHLWPSFITELERHATTLTGDASAVGGALRAFDLFEQAASMMRPLPAR
jgi:heme oxygenase